VPSDLPTSYQDLYPLIPPTATMAVDRSHIRRVMAARVELEVARADVATAEQALREAARAANEAGDSWRVIGAALGISRQAAEQRFRRRS
jgi:hypothetical protein